MWLDDCRIPFVDEDWNSAMDKRKSFVKTGGGHQNQYVGGSLENPIDTLKSINQQGRFTPNLLVCDDMLNDGSVSKTNTSIIKPSNNSNSNILGGGKGIPPTKERKQNGDSGSSSRYYDLDKWFDNVIDNL